MKNFTSKESLRKGISRSLIALFSLMFGVIFSTNVMATVVITAATGGTGISADKATGGPAQAWTTLGVIKVTEGVPTDFAANQNNKTMVLLAPSNYIFNTAAGVVTQVGTGFQNTAAISVTSTTITVTFSTNASTTSIDAIWISGIQVRAVDGSNLTTQYINRGTGTATINFPITTNFGNLNSIAGNLDHFSFGSISSPQTAGNNFSISITAVDWIGNVRTNYNSSINLTTTAGTITPSSTGTGWSSGVKTMNVNVSLAATARKITATDPATSKYGTSGNFDVIPNSLVKLQLLVPGESSAPGTTTGKTGTPNAENAGSAFNVTVNAVDANWNLVNSSNVIGFTSSDPDATLPNNAALISGTNTYSFVFNSCSTANTTQTILASDSTNSAITSSNSPSITVHCPTPSITSISPSCALTGDGDEIIDITGTNFVTSSLVIFHSNTYTPVFLSSTSLEVTISGSEFVNSGTRFMHIKNPGNLTSNTVNFTVSINPAFTDLINHPGGVTTSPSDYSEVLFVCEGASNVTFTANASGDNLTYQWYNSSGPINNATSSSYTIYNAGMNAFDDYYVVVTGACSNSDNDVITSDSYTLVVNPKPQFILSESPTTCHTSQGTSNTTHDGSITITPDDLGPNYAYSINGGSTFPQSDPNNYYDNINQDSISADIFADLNAGNYTIVIQDDSGCVSDPVVEAVTQPDSMSFVILAGNPVTGQEALTNVYESCFGFNDVHIYILQPYQETDTINALAFPQFDNIDSLPFGPIGGTPDQFGYFTMSIDSGYTWPGYGEYDYAPLNGAGTYYVVAEDGNGCRSAILATTILQPTSLEIDNINTSYTNVHCYGAGDGSVHVTATGGNTPYGYNISTNYDPYDFTNTSGNFTGLDVGTYTVTVQDNNGCQNTYTFTISQPATPLTVICSGTNLTCFNSGDGTTNVIPSGGWSANYSYIWSDNSSQTTEQATGLSALTTGTSYTVTVTDANNCTVTCSSTITEPTQLTVTITSSNNHGFAISCYGGSDGADTADASGGTSGYTYFWNPENGNNPITGLSVGTYAVTATDANGCTAIAFNVLSSPPAIVINSVTPSVFGSYNLSCYGGSNGFATVSTSGGTSVYSYIWSDNSSQTTNPATGLSANTSGNNGTDYSVTVTDNNNCSTNSSVNLTEPDQLAADTASTQITCYNAHDGTITITNPTGGNGTYEYSIDGIVWLSNTFQNGLLLPNNDAYNYVGVGQFTGLGPNDIEILIRDAQETTCSVSLEDIPFGNPSVITSTNILTDYGPNAFLQVDQNISCYGSTDASIYEYPSGGTPPYSYTWCNCGGSESSSYDNYTGGNNEYDGIGAGTYSVSITDANNCPAYIDYPTVVGPTEAITINTYYTFNETCQGSMDGTILFADVEGGDGFYNWSDDGGTSFFANNGQFSGLDPNGSPYALQVIDFNGCLSNIINGVYIQAASPITIGSVTPNNVTCVGAGDGTITISGVTGGGITYDNSVDNFSYHQYFYSIDNGTTWQASNSYSGLALGTYNVVVVDSIYQNINGDEDYPNYVITACAPVSWGTPIVISQPATPLTVPCSGTSLICNNDNSGTVSANATGGWSSYSYAWSNSGTDGTITGLAIGTYTVTVTDGNGCVVICSTSITQPDPITYTTIANDANSGQSGLDLFACGLGNDVDINTANFAGGTPGYTVYINGDPADFDYPFLSAPNAGPYVVTVHDANGCISTATTITITEPSSALSLAQISESDVTCYGGEDGSITVSASNGYPTYMYDWGGGPQPTGGFTALNFGLYEITVTDIHGCTSEVDIPVGQPDQLNATPVGHDVSCFGGSNGSITFTNVSGGHGNYLFSVDGSNFYSTTIPGLSAGTYTVEMEDADYQGCNLLLSPDVVIGQPATSVSASVTSHTDVSCPGGSNGTITVTASGGTPSYTGDGIQSGLSAGTYTFTVSDNNGCTATASGSVGTVPDVTPPVITCNGGDYNVNNDVDVCGANVTVGIPTVSDNCSGTFNAMNFDGVDDYVSIPEVPAFDITTNITMEGWVYPTGSNTIQDVFCKSSQSHNTGYIFPRTDNDWTSFDCYLFLNGNWVTVTAAYPSLNTWHHLAMTYDGSNIKLYLDGSLVQTHAVSGAIATNSNPLTIAEQPGFSQEYFGGSAQELRLWNVARTQAQIQANMNSEISSDAGLVAVYHLNQGVAGGNNTAITTVTDGSGNNNTGSINNMTMNGGTSNFVSGAPAVSSLTYSNNFNSTQNASGVYPIGATTVLWTATDGSGNTATCSQTVTVTDNQAPVITSCPSSVTYSADNGSCSIANVTLSGATATDNCTVQGISYNPVSGSTFNVGTTTVTVTATDNHSNTATCSFTVTVNDTQAPVISTCPSNATYSADNGNCSKANVTYLATATDNCAVQSINYSPASGSTFSVGITTVTVTATDNHTNTATCSFTVTVNDTQVPVITSCPSNVTYNDDNGVCTKANVTYTALASDNCTVSSIVYSPASGSTFSAGYTTVTVTATDNHSNTATCSFTVDIIDNQAPIISSCGSSQSAYANGSCQASVPDIRGNVSATDNCTLTSSSSWTQSPVAGTLEGLGVTTITVTVSDISGNTATCSTTFTLSDNTPPSITSCPNVSYNATTGQCSLTGISNTVTATDNCGTTNYSFVPVLSSQFNVGVSTVTATVNDGHGNSTTCSFTVTIVDNQPPVISCNNSSSTVNNDNNNCSAVVSYTAPTATDNCGGSTNLSVTFNYTGSSQSFNVPGGTTSISIQAFGASGGNGYELGDGISGYGGLGGSASGNLSVTPNSTLYVYVGGAGAQGSTNYTTASGGFNGGGLGGYDNSGQQDGGGGGGGASDVRQGGQALSNRIIVAAGGGGGGGGFFGSNGGGAGGGLTGSNGVDQNSAYGGTGGTQSSGGLAYETTRGATNGDLGLGGNGSSNQNAWGSGAGGGGYYGGGGGTGTQDHGNGYAAGGGGGSSFIDGVTSGSTTSGVQSGSGYIVISYAVPYPTVAQTSGLSSGSTFPLGGTTNTFLATDAHGNTSTCSFTVTVVDSQAPTISSCGGGQSAYANGSCNANVPDFTSGVSATDNCTSSGSLVITQSPTVGTPVTIGVTTVTLTVADAAGNTSTCSTTFSVSDNSAPVITSCGSYSANADPTLCSKAGITYSAAGTDNCGTVSFTYNPLLSSTFNVGTSTVTATANDGNGNTSTCSFTVTINDNQAPTISNCPVSDTAARSCPGTVSWTAPTASDNCGVTGFAWVSTGATSTSGAGNVSTASLNDGVTTITYTASDAPGNTSTCAFTITILQISLAANSPSYNGVNIKCHGDANGIINTVVTNGSGGYLYAWTPSEGNVATASSLSAGAYTVTVTAANGPCTATATYTETQPTNALSSTATVTNVTGCFYTMNGAINLSPTGGTTGYTYSWSGVVNNGYSTNGSYSSNNQNLSGLDSGVYTVTITDANSCTNTLSKVVSSPAALRVQFAITIPTCYNSGNGKITLLATEGSTPSTPYNYSDNNGATFQNSPNFFGNLNAGTYTMIVTDHNGCTSTDTSPDTVISFGPTPVTISVGSITSNHMIVTAGGGTAPYKFKQNSSSFVSETNPYTYTNTSCPTGYSYVVEDHNNCTSPTVGPYHNVGCREEGDLLPENSNTTLFVYPNPASDHITVLFSANEEESYNLRLFDILGQLIQTYSGSTTIGDNQMEINLSTIAKGVYIVDIEHGTTTGKIRIVVQ